MLNSGVFSGGKIKFDFPTIDNTGGTIKSQSSIELHAPIKLTLGAGGRLIAQGKITLASPEIMIERTEVNSATNEIEIFADRIQYKNLDERTIQMVKDNVRYYAEYLKTA